MDAWLSELAQVARVSFETTGILVIVAGALWATLSALRDLIASRGFDLHRYRSRLGRSILLGLEFLVAGDIINTVAFEPNLRSVLVLAGIVLIRTFLSFSLEVEIDGKWPWQRQASAPDPQ